MSRIVRIHEYGDASVLRIEDVAVPAPAADEVQIAVKAIGINRAEVMFRTVNTLHRDRDAGCLLEVFSRNEIGLVVDDEGLLVGLITKMDLVDFLAAKPS